MWWAFCTLVVFHKVSIFTVVAGEDPVICQRAGLTVADCAAVTRGCCGRLGAVVGFACGTGLRVVILVHGAFQAIGGASFAASSVNPECLLTLRTPTQRPVLAALTVGCAF